MGDSSGRTAGQHCGLVKAEEAEMAHCQISHTWVLGRAKVKGRGVREPKGPSMIQCLGKPVFFTWLHHQVVLCLLGKSKLEFSHQLYKKKNIFSYNCCEDGKL